MDLVKIFITSNIMFNHCWVLNIISDFYLNLHQVTVFNLIFNEQNLFIESLAKKKLSVYL